MVPPTKGCKFVERKRKEKKRKKKEERRKQKTQRLERIGETKAEKQLQRKQQRISQGRNQNSQAMMFPKITNYPRKRRRIKM